MIAALASRRALIGGMGLTQILGWGSSYYLVAIIAAPVSAELGMSLPLAVGGLSVAMVVAGLSSPAVGKAIARRGGRDVLALGSVLFGLGLAFLGIASGPVSYLLAWVLLGCAMSAGLYDAAFATLGKQFGREARSMISALTLWGGFASTISWPVTTVLLETIGWRAACFVYAGLHVGIALQLHAFLVPRTPREPSVRSAGRARSTVAPSLPSGLLIMGGIVVLGGATSSVVSVHALTWLQAEGLPLAAAVGAAALIGPSQVAARMVEMRIGRRCPASHILVLATGLVAGGVALLMLGPAFVAIALIAYGCGNGIYSISRGAVPLQLFSPGEYPVRMGQLALPSLAAQAAAPPAAAMLAEQAGVGLALAVVSLLALGNVILALYLAFVAANRERSQVAEGAT